MALDPDFIEKVFDYVENKMVWGSRVLIERITDDPQRFIDTVKYLINTNRLDNNDIFFRAAYTKEGEKLGDNDYRILCKTSIPIKLTKLRKDGIKNDTDRESGPGPGNEEPGQ